MAKLVVLCFLLAIFPQFEFYSVRLDDSFDESLWRNNAKNFATEVGERLSNIPIKLGAEKSCIENRKETVWFLENKVSADFDRCKLDFREIPSIRDCFYREESRFHEQMVDTERVARFCTYHHCEIEDSDVRAHCSDNSTATELFSEFLSVCHYWGFTDIIAVNSPSLMKKMEWDECFLVQLEEHRASRFTYVNEILQRRKKMKEDLHKTISSNCSQNSIYAIRTTMNIYSKLHLEFFKMHERISENNYNECEKRKK